MAFDPDTERFCGGDGAASCPLPGGRTLWLFGDSCIAAVVDGRYQPGWWMTNNVAAVTVDPPRGEAPAPGSAVARFGDRPEPGEPSGFVVPPAGGRARWSWPCDGAIVVGPAGEERLLIFYGDLARRVDEPAPGEVWNFKFVGNRVAIIENPSEAPKAWRVVQHALEPRDSGRMKDGAPTISWGVVVMRDPESSGDRLVIFGVDGSNPFNKQAVVARVQVAKAHDFSEWRFWTGSSWSPRESEAATVINHVVDEFTIHHEPARGDAERGRWLLIQGEPVLGHRILVRQAPTPLGPWSDGHPIYTVPEPSNDEKLITYGAKAHPHLSAPGELLISYCINSLDFGSLSRDVEIYRPRFLRVPAALLHGPDRAAAGPPDSGDGRRAKSAPPRPSTDEASTP